MKDILHLKPQVLCNLYISGELINQNKNCVDIIVPSDKTYITVEPLDYHYSPYSFLIYDYDCPYVHYIPYPHHCDLVITPPPLYDYSMTAKLFYEIVGKYYVDIFTCGKCFIIISDGKKELLRHETTMLISAYAYMLGDYLVVIGNTGKRNQIIIFNMKDNAPCYDILADSVDLKDDTILSLSSNHDIAGTGLVYNIKYDSELKVESYYVYLSDMENEPYHSNLIPMTFLQSIKIKNYKYALSKLSFDSTNEHLIEYFGDIKNIYLNMYYQDKDKVNITIYNGKYHNYTFSISELKIMDIEENKL